MQWLKWRISECGGGDMPATIDDTSSPTTVYVRRNFKLVTKDRFDGEEGAEPDTAWQYEEIFVPREKWDNYKDILLQSVEVSNVQNAIEELSAMVAELYDKDSE